MTIATRELRASFAFVERNFNLTKRYWGWEVAWLVYSLAAALAVAFIGVAQDDPVLLQTLIIGAIFWNFLSIVFGFIGETVTWERWEGTLEYTFMAPVRRYTQLVGSTFFAVAYAVIQMVIILVVMLLFFDVEFTGGNWVTAAIFLALGSLSFVGVGMMAAILPLLYVERGDQMVFVIQSVILLFSGVYYTSDILPEWMQFVGLFSPGTYVLEGDPRRPDPWPAGHRAVAQRLAAGGHGRRAHPARRLACSASPSATRSAPASSRELDRPMRPMCTWGRSRGRAESPASSCVRTPARPTSPRWCASRTRSGRPMASRTARPSRSARAWYGTRPSSSMPARDVTIAELDGRMVGYRPAGTGSTRSDGLREHRSWGRGRSGLAAARHRPALLRDSERQRSCAGRVAARRSAPLVLGTWSRTTATWRHALARSARATSWCAGSSTWCGPASIDDLPEAPPLPDGIEVRPVDDRQLLTIWRADLEAFRDHWGGSDESEEAFMRRYLESPDFDPSLWVVAWDGDEVAAA